VATLTVGEVLQMLCQPLVRELNDVVCPPIKQAFGDHDASVGNEQMGIALRTFVSCHVRQVQPKDLQAVSAHVEFSYLH
jgi:hypothetical protein